MRGFRRFQGKTTLPRFRPLSTSAAGRTSSASGLLRPAMAWRIGAGQPLVTEARGTETVPVAVVGCAVAVVGSGAAAGFGGAGGALLGSLGGGGGAVGSGAWDRGGLGPPVEGKGAMGLLGPGVGNGTVGLMGLGAVGVLEGGGAGGSPCALMAAGFSLSSGGVGAL